MNVVIGTAGHIDHGKTALVRALTGVDADRLPEEKRRGITIDIGFADTKIGEMSAAFIDVPGHEKFVKNMLAGASGIDLVLLVVAADEGVMPQTREHFEICRLLGIEHGIVALTKSDLADAETRQVARAEVEELVVDSFLAGSPIIAVSSRTGDGLDALRACISAAASKVPSRKGGLIARLCVDRSFAAKGFGTVVTGTLLSGEIRPGDELELLPVSRDVKVRGIQIHGHSESTAVAGRRVALNLSGISHGEVRRGMVLAERGVLRPTSIIDCEIEVLESALKTRQRVRVHIGTQEVIGRVYPLADTGEITGRGLAQIRLEAPAVAVHGDRFIIRRYSPQETIAGGIVLDPRPQKHRRSEFTAAVECLERIAAAADRTGLLRALIQNAGPSGTNRPDLLARTGWSAETLSKTFADLGSAARKAGERFIATAEFDRLKAEVIARVTAHHAEQPLSKGVSRESLRSIRPEAADLVDAVIEILIAEKKLAAKGDVVSLFGEGPRLSSEEAKVSAAIKAALEKAGLEVPKEAELTALVAAKTGVPEVKVRAVLRVLIEGGEVFRISADMVFARESIEKLIATLRSYASEQKGDREIDVGRFKTLTGVSRKYAIPLLEYLDREKITVRVGDRRIIRQ